MIALAYLATASLIVSAAVALLLAVGASPRRRKAFDAHVESAFEVVRGFDHVEFERRYGS